MFLNIGQFLERVKHRPTHWVMLITLVGMGLSLVFHLLIIPKHLGGSGTTDALIAALKVVLIIDIIVREGAKFSLIPFFIKEEESLTSKDFQCLTNAILTFIFSVGIVFMVLIQVCATWIVLGLLPNRSLEVQAEMVTFLRLCSPLIIFGCGSTILGAYLNSKRRFKSVAFRNALPPGIATAVFLLLSKSDFIANYVLIGYASGFLVFFIYLFIGMQLTGHRYRLTLISLDALCALKNTISLPTLGFAIRQITARILVEVFFIGKLGNGAITLYNCAFRIFSAIQTLIGISIATTGLPDMAVDSIQDNRLKLKRSLFINIRNVVVITVPLTLLLIIGSTRIAQFLYVGSRFDEQEVKQIAHLIFLLSMGTIFSCLIPILNAGLYAQKAYRFIFRNMVTMAILNSTIAYVFVTIWGLSGIALTVSATALFAVTNLVYLLSKTGLTLHNNT